MDSIGVVIGETSWAWVLQHLDLCMKHTGLGNAVDGREWGKRKRTILSLENFGYASLSDDFDPGGTPYVSLLLLKPSLV